jgi:hypothetical protein
MWNTGLLFSITALLPIFSFFYTTLTVVLLEHLSQQEQQFQCFAEQ